MTASTQKIPSGTASKTVRCLVVQLARLGDTLQSLMALRAAKQLYPQLEITFVARETFSSAVKRVPWIHEVVTLPSDSLIGPIIRGEKSVHQTLPEIAKWASPLLQTGWDLAINWSYSEASSFLMGLIPSRVKLGYTRRRDSTFFAADGWSHYIQAIVQGGVNQNIHLTDILTTQLLTALQIHIGDSQADGNTPVTSKSFFSLSLTDEDLKWSSGDYGKKWIGMQLGAGQESKTWSPRQWAKLASYILQRHPEAAIVLMGGKEDKEREELFFEELKNQGHQADEVTSYVGKTTFDLWTSIVSKCTWLLAGDTAAIHLASVLGTRVLNLSIGPVKFAETGPYGNGHYVISSPDGVHVTAESVYAVWSYATHEWAHRRQITVDSHFSQLGWSNQLQKVQIYRSKIRSTDDGGGVVYEPLLKRTIEIADWSSTVMGYVARSWYCGWVPPVGQEIQREMIGPPLIQKLRELNESSEVLQKICQQGTQTATLLNQKGSTLKSEKVMSLAERQELRDLANQLFDMEKLIDRLAQTQPTLNAFSHMLKVLMHNLKGNQLADLGKEAAGCYRQLSEGVTLFREWITHTLGMVKPVALKPGSVAPLELAHRPSGKDVTP